MASINICERKGCDSFIKGNAVGGITLVMSSDDRAAGDPDTVLRMELCPACVEDVHRVLTIEPLERRERSYSEPFHPAGKSTDDVLSASAEQLAAALFEKLMAQQNKAIGGGDGYHAKPVNPPHRSTMSGRTIDHDE